MNDHLDIKIAPNKFFNYIKKKGIITGSYVFGGWVDGSDIDIILYYDSFISQFEEFFTFPEFDKKFESYPGEKIVAYVKNKKGIKGY